MRRKTIVQIVLIIIFVYIGAIFVNSNPSRYDFEAFVKDYIENKGLQDGGITGFTEFWFPGFITKNSTINRQNYLFFSVHEISYGETHLVFIGINDEFYLMN